MAVKPSFELMQREQCKASIMIEGLTGRGKSGAALLLAYGLAGGFSDSPPEDAWKKVYAVDTENRSLGLFVGVPGSFGQPYGQAYTAQLSPEDGYAPSHYLAIREAAKKAGGEVFIADSITHMWQGTGGVLDLVTKAKQDDPKMDNYRVWGLPKVMSEKQKLTDVIRDSDIHTITTVRLKEKFTLEWDNDKGGNKVVSLGEQQMQQDGLKYEPDLVLQMLRPGKAGVHPLARVLKSRYAIFAEGEEYELTPQLAEQLRAYLAEGEDPQVLLEKQREDYAEAVKAYLDSKPTAQNIWRIIKADAGHADTKLTDLPLGVLKQLYGQLVSN